MRHASIRGYIRHGLKRSNHFPQLNPSVRDFHSHPCLQSYKFGPFTIDDEAFVPKPEPNPKAQKIAILGGGVTGLTTAFHLSKTIPEAKITLLEASNRLGGWIHSEKREVDGGEVLFEWGPRSLRPDVGGGLATAALLQQLGLTESIVNVSKWSEAALNRFIYFPDHLVRLPRPRVARGFLNLLSYVTQSLGTVLREPAFSGVLSALLAEVAVQPRPTGVKDESVGDFLRRRFGVSIADNLASALFHGIYAGDIYKLSARTLLSVPWYLEKRDPDGGSVLAEAIELMVKRQSLAPERTLEFIRQMNGSGELDKSLDRSIRQKLAGASVYTFVDGLEQLTRGLEQVLRQSKNVSIAANSSAKGLSFDSAKKTITVKAENISNSHEEQFDYVVSTLPPSFLQSSLSPAPTSPLAKALAKCNTAATVMVVNLYYSNPDLIPPHHAGFGYLIPRSIPSDQNPERALGVIFSSSSSGPRGSRSPSPDQVDGEQDSEPERTLGQDSAPGTKLTVMLGGHWWSDWTPSDLPSETEAIEMSRSVLARHLGITDPPTLALAKLASNAIPQYPVHYREYMATVHSALMTSFEGRLKLAGPWYQGGVGVNDCVRRAREVALYIREGMEGCTGLQHYVGDEVFYVGDRRTGRMRIDETD